MLKDNQTFSGFSVKDESEAKTFFENILGIEVDSDEMGLHLHLQGQNPVFVYGKEDHVPATFTVLNFITDDIDATVDGLIEKGVTFEHYDMPGAQDEKGIMRGKSANRGPDIAWFKDPSGNIFSVLSN